MKTAKEHFIRPLGTCKKCGRETEAQLWQQTTTSGSVVYLYRCTNCGQSGPFWKGVYISKQVVLKRLSESDIEALPKAEAYELFYCERCGRIGAEYHHMAPKAIFGTEEAENWPKCYLCPEHHNEWHAAIENYYAAKHVGK